MSKNSKNKVVTVRVSDDDLEFLDARCDELGMSRSEFMYGQIFTEHKRPTVDKEIKAIFRLCLMNLASQIYQEVRTMNPPIKGELQEDLHGRWRAAAASYENTIRASAESRIESYLDGLGWSETK